MGWLQQNSPFLAVFAAVVALLYYNFGFDGVYRACLVALGLGLVIFVHELGHFLTAKWCNVHVQTFSLGFGPALPGCSFKYGETTYKIGILPLGGYVQMVGEGADADEDENYPRSYKNKTVLQRMLIISAGVVMNVLLGCVCFIVVYQFHGMPMPPAIVWRVDAGSPAWKAGVPTGALSPRSARPRSPPLRPSRRASPSIRGGPAPSTWSTRRSTARRHTVDLRPRHDANDSQPVIGVSPPGKLQLLAGKEPRRLRAGPPSTTPRPRRPARWTCGPATWWCARPTRPRKATPSPTCRTTWTRARSTRRSCASACAAWATGTWCCTSCARRRGR